MKTRLLLVLCVSCFIFSGFKTSDFLITHAKSVSQEMNVNAIFDGHEDYGYNFIAEHSDGEEYTLTFQKVNDAILKEFDLNAEVLVGAKFKITYTTKIVVTKDADGYDDENEINTIIKLEKL